ncbi:MAG: hypothetical protein ACYS0G_13980 [Planctomycetota bacterium]|jgi:hypothetical protein
MRAITAPLLGSCLFALVGCTWVRHHVEPYHAAGTALPIEVTVGHKPDEPVSGTVYHRAVGGAAYQAASMKLRGDQLWALLPTDHLGSEDTVEYYIDVMKGGKLIALGSPGSPYAVTVLDRSGMVRSNLHDRLVASDDEHEVRILLMANRQPIDQPRALYQMPGVPGDIRAPMEADGRGNYRIIIPPLAVRPGTWRYAIEVPFNGETFRLPRHGYRSFVVTPAYHEEATAEASP